MDKEKIISEALQKCGIACNLKGYVYAKEAVSIAVDQPDVVFVITTKLYPMVAEKCDCPKPSRVERAIRHGLEIAWEKTSLTVLKEVLGPGVTSKAMTCGEFIATLAEQVRWQLHSKAS